MPLAQARPQFAKLKLLLGLWSREFGQTAAPIEPLVVEHNLLTRLTYDGGRGDVLPVLSEGNKGTRQGKLPQTSLVQALFKKSNLAA